MTAETLTADRAKRTFPAHAGAFGNLNVAWGRYEIAANVEDGDIFEMVRLPPNATVVMGWLFADDLDTGTEALDMDIGWAGNGVDTADPDGFGNLGVMGTDTVAGIKPESGYNYQFGGTLITDGPRTFSKETIVQVTCVATAATFAAGTLSVAVYYYVP